MINHYLNELERRTSYLSYVERVEIERLIEKIREEVKELEVEE